MEAVVSLRIGQPGPHHTYRQVGWTGSALIGAEIFPSFVTCGRNPADNGRRFAVSNRDMKNRNRILDMTLNKAMPNSFRLDMTVVNDAESSKLPALTILNSNKKFGHQTCRCQKMEEEGSPNAANEDSADSLGVQLALVALKFYRREISPFLPGSCRYVPTCSEYSMQAYKTYGVLKGTILTACRLARCNPLGGTGFDPPRWFGEEKPPSF